MSFEEIQGKAGGGAVGEETDNDQRKNLRWETGAFQKIFKKPETRSRKPEARRTPTAARRPTSVGRIPSAV